jgi:hypothetical protein
LLGASDIISEENEASPGVQKYFMAAGEGKIFILMLKR